MKNPIIKSLLFAFLFGLVSMSPTTVHKFTSEEAKYSIIFPSEFNIEEKRNETYSGKQVQALFNNQLFFVAHHVHLAELSDHEELAKVSLESFVEALSATVTSQKEWVVNKNKGIHANIKSAANELIGEYKIVLIGQTQYQITVMSAEEKWNQAAANKFFNSFKMKK